MRKLTINVTLDEGKVTELESIESVYNRTEFVADYDDPISIAEAVACIRDELNVKAKNS